MTTLSSEPTPIRSTSRALVGSSSEQFRLPLRGRAAEASIVADAVRGVEAGESRTLLFRGVAGVGKTRLLGEILRSTSSRGWGTVLAVPEPDSHLLPTAVLVDAAVASQPPLLSADEIVSLSGDADSRYWLGQTLQNALEALTTERNVVVVVDDLQWADSATLAILRSLIAGLTDVPILWVFAIRTGEYGPAVQQTLARLSGFATEVTVAPLHESAVGEMATDLLGARPDDALAHTLRRAENLPLLITELVQGLVEEKFVSVVGNTATARDEQLPERFGASIRERITHLPDRAADLVQVASTLGRSFTVANLAEMLGGDTLELLNGVNAAIQADIFIDGSPLLFRHDAIRETAESMLNPSVRTYLRRRAADIRVRSGEPLLAVASSIAESAQRGDAEAVVMLHNAALQLVSSDATSAANLARRAVELCTSPDQNPLLAELIPVLWVGGASAMAKDLARDLSASLDRDQAARVQLAIARLETESSFTAAIQTCDAALALPGLSVGVRAQLLAVRALNLANIGDHSRLAASLVDARAAAEEAGEFAALATVNATESVFRFYEHRFDEATALIESALEQMASVPDFVAAQWLPEGLWPAFLANSIGDGPRALAIAEMSVNETQQTRSAIALAYWTMVRARTLFDLGRLDEAKMHAETVMTMAEELGLGDFAQATAGLVIYRVALHQGDYASCQAWVGKVQEMADGVPLHLAGTWLLALTADADGHVDALSRLTEDAYTTLDAAAPSMTTPADFGDDARLARMWVQAGAVDRLPRLLAVTRTRAEANPTNVLARGIHEQVQGIVTGSTDQLHAAVQSLRLCSRPLVLAVALEDLGISMDDAGVAGADVPWREAVDIFEERGAIREAGRVLKRLRDVGVLRRPKSTPNHRGVLSPREQDVAQRLASGSTTKQIASDLSLSQYTVITHVRHIYDKWGISNRKALVQRVVGG
jgi:DNA-binding CsgD family transcriptional regulator/tetratricopeptide (TPR) repeat protein